MLKTSKQLDSDAFKQLFEGMGDASLIFKGGHFISANQAAVDLLNYPDKATLIKRLPAEISPPNQPDGQESGAKAEIVIARSLDIGPQRTEWVFLKCDGTLVTAELMLTPVYIDGEQLLHIVLRDLTKQKQAESKLIKSESRLEEVQRYAQIGHWELLKDSTIATWSEQMYIIFGLSPEAESGPETLCDIIHENDCSNFMESLQDSFATGEEHHVEYRITRQHDGEKRWIECRGNPVINNDGTVEKISGFIQDITERKVAEESLRDSEKKSRDAKLQLQNVIYGAKLGFWDWNYKTGEQVVNDEWLLMLGLTQKNTAHHISYWEELIHPDDKKALTETIHQHIKSKTSYVIEFRMKHADGSWIWIQGSGGVVEYDEITGEPLRLCGTHQNITPRKKADERYKRILDNSLTEIFIFEAETYRFLKANRGAKKNIGYSSEELLKLTPLDIKPEMTLDKFNTLLEPLRDGSEEIIHFETIHRRKNGTDYPVEIHLQLTDYSSKPAFISIILDITVRKTAMDKLKLSSRVFTDTHEGITITDADMNIIDVNPAFNDITGYSREEVLGKNPRLLSSGQQSPQFYKDMWQQLNEYGHWQAEIWNRTKGGELYAELLNISSLTNDDDVVVNYVGVFLDITASKRQQEKLNLMAHYDVLTKLPNRALFTDRFTQGIAHSKRAGKQLAVCFLDLDDFKPVNDDYGHETGDKLLIEVGKRITSSIRDDDTVSRQGGDEFAILLNDIESITQCEQTLARIHHSLAQPYYIDGRSHRITASSGATLYPNDNGDIDTLLRHADQAMYRSKQQGKHRYQLFNHEENQRAVQKHLQLNAIEQALVNNEFQLYYQPKVSMVTGDVFGAEALIRWIHPEKGLIPPLDFLPLVDGTELELTIGDWVINNGLTQIDEWLQQGIKLEVSVNISSDHLLSDTFVANLEGALARHSKVDPQCLQLEILESSALGDLDAITVIIETCKGDLGVKVALDDFGTGYSSLTHLRSLPVDTIKIDQSFIRDVLDDPSDYAIIDGVIGLSDSFNRDVIAEGVETSQHGSMLLLMGCKQAQGYGISKPVPAADFPQWLNEYVPNEEWMHIGNKNWSRKENKVKQFRLIAEHWENRFIENVQSLAGNAKRWPIMSSKFSPFGSWIKREIQDKLFESEGLEQLNQTHKIVHDTARSIHQYYQAGEIEAARKGLPGLQSAFQQMNNTLGMLE